MERKHILDSLKQYKQLSKQYKQITAKDNEAAAITNIERFIRRETNCFNSNNLNGHLTGSALIVNSDYSKVLLTLHTKLQLWLQLGGHCDADETNLASVALREAIEESGIESFTWFPLEKVFKDNISEFDNKVPFDIDIHLIASTRKQEHTHYDIRYLLVTDKPEQIKITEESSDLQWFCIEDAYKVTSDRSMHRQFDKLKWLKQQL